MGVSDAPCLDCERPRSEWKIRATNGNRGARGLCGRCYSRRKKNDTLDDFPRTTYSADELLDEWQFLRSNGYNVQQAGERLGLRPGSLERALHRAKNRGDERAMGFQIGRPSKAQRRQIHDQKQEERAA